MVGTVILHTKKSPKFDFRHPKLRPHSWLDTHLPPKGIALVAEIKRLGNTVMTKNNRKTEIKKGNFINVRAYSKQKILARECARISNVWF
ncbi:MAG: hypothetical protein A2249_01275 [Candidatus Jacksonbacteria bacterium RIFOXYA2_FULL_44_7]|uniref:Uncharacterized protein n=1 Tax=Candidatus Jacksonbacteria bacterium RIFCSPLOWO2_02_FULL_44_20 TaxID=1798460 RepID=A0A1G2AC70_9BACT|nr:MAG: hypothetical protein A3E05_02680 [Candidatus Jacksonbacteria bacterium RIFCSPHIGHO2_12_FULL_44_12]OGY74255.1 MAG: hypothetical protein A3H61_01365 [Candidatus Jacksonbacteria bacterium RIFCSPLOWO2_02_FULL_44_20]OGY77054.1 MAG: hypothetical protein A2249_01275 [Candidatus Jacksonbacteria bacterium RIFOXYA2_FULL_44_7]HCA66932.1 hypothetical protein [Candidatus Jacksonbacteria bacterium]